MQTIPSKRFLFTGTSGIGLRKSLKKLADRVGQVNGGKPPTVLFLDDFFDESRELRVPDFLGKPKKILSEGWKTAHELLCKRANEVEEAGRDVFLHFHASWYHQGLEEFTTLVVPELLKKHNAEFLVTVIDDIYDVRDRLLKSGRLLVHSLPESATFAASFCREVEELLFVLRWREVEFLLSELIGRLTTATEQCYLIAAKHPVDTFYSLLYEQAKEKLYLSHPISEVQRRLQENSSDQEAKKLQESIDGLSTALQRDFVVFAPTAIDELRFRSDKPATDSVGARWPILRGSLFWEPAEPGELPIAPFAGIKTKGNVITDDQRAVVERALSQLRREITQQINWRDHKLVAQSGCLAVWRPLYLGHESTGVKQEMSYAAELSKSETTNRTIMVYSPGADATRYPEWALAGTIQTWISDGIIDGAVGMLDQLVDRVRSGGGFVGASNSTDTAKWGSMLRALVDELDLTLVVDKIPRRQGALMTAQPAHIIDDWLGHTAGLALKTAAATVPYLDELEQQQEDYPHLKVMNRDDENMSPEAFAVAVKQGCTEA